MSYYIPTKAELKKQLVDALMTLPCQCCGAKLIAGTRWRRSIHVSHMMEGLDLPLCDFCGGTDDAILDMPQIREAIRLRLDAIRKGASPYCSGLHLLQRAKLEKEDGETDD